LGRVGLSLMMAMILLFVLAASAVAAPPKTRFEQTDASIAYYGSWTTLARSFHSAGDYAYTNRAGGKAVVKFTGEGIDYVTNKDTMYGVVKVTVDGNEPQFVDLYNPIRNIAQSVVVHAAPLAMGEHVMTIEWTGLKNPASTGFYVGLDAVDIVGTIDSAFMVTTPSAGLGGGITPATPQSTRYGDRGPSFVITPEAHYHIADVLVDGVSAGAVSSYSFGTLTSNHTIAASFARDTRTITAVAGSHGAVSPSGSTAVPYGDSQTFTFTPDTGYRVSNVIVDGVSVGGVTSYTFDDVVTAHTISVTFTLSALTITPSAGLGGSITPAAAQLVLYGGNSATFTIAPAAGYLLADVRVDGESVGAITSYRFLNVTASHTIAASFTRNPVQRFEQSDSMIAYDGDWRTLAKPFHSAGSYAYTNTSGGKAIVRFHGTSIDYITNKDALYGVVKVTLDGGEPSLVDLYNPVRNIAQSRVWSASDLEDADHVLTIEWTGLKNPASPNFYVGLDAVDIRGTLLPAAMTITPDAGLHGSISPAGSTTVNCTDDSPLFTITADTHYHVEDVSVDGSSVGGAGGTTATYRFTNVLANHTLSATFDIDKVQIETSAGSHGSVSSPGGSAADYGSDKTFSITPDTGYHVVDVLVDGESVGPVTSYEFTNVTDVHSISATFAIDTFTLTPSSGVNGAISPDTQQSIDYGAGREFTFTPDAHYHVDDVLVDGESVGAAGSYAFTDVRASHTIQVSFSVDTNTIHASSGDNGSVSPAGDTLVGWGSDQSYAITPDTGYHVADVLVDGESVGAVTSYEFTDVQAGHTVSATFEPDSRTISASAGANGSISPAGDTSVAYGSDQGFSITPDTGYHIADVLVDGDSVGAVSSYEFTSVTAGHTISASFAIDTFTLNPSSGAHGAVSPATPQSVDYGSDREFTFTPDPHYHIADVLVDDVSVGAVASYDFTSVTSNHTIAASFAIDTNSITASAGANGSISSAGVSAVPYGADKSFTITPDAGYHVADVLVDGSSVGAVSSYDFTNVTAAHTISVSFAINTYTITSSAGSGGSVSPSGDRSVNHGSSSATYVFTPNAGSYIADVIVDGVSWGYMPTLQLTNVTAGHTILVTFGLSANRYEQTDSRIAYSGTWESRTKTFHSGGTYACTRYAAAKVTIKFSGTGMDYITNKDSQYGIAKVTLDGGTPQDVDLYSGERNVFQSKVWTVSGLPNTTHTVVVEYTGRKNPASSGYWIGLDAVNLTGELVQAP
jgi:predicted ester cyclase